MILFSSMYLRFLIYRVIGQNLWTKFNVQQKVSPGKNKKKKKT